MCLPAPGFESKLRESGLKVWFKGLASGSDRGRERDREGGERKRVWSGLVWSGLDLWPDSKEALGGGDRGGVVARVILCYIM